MNKELKELIDSVDSTNRAHSDLETLVRHLKDEIQRLNFTINEQKRIIQTQNVKLSNLEKTQVPEDVQILKELVLNQRDDMKKKDKDIEILQRVVEELSMELENAKKYNDDTDEINYANKIIVQLTEENENLIEEINKLKLKLSRIDSGSTESEAPSPTQDIDLELVDAKKMIYQLQEENGINRVKVESLKAQVDKLEIQLEDTKGVKNQYLKELDESTQTIQELNKKVELLQETVSDLENELKIASEEMKEHDTEIIRDIRDKIIQLSEENSKLKDELALKTNRIDQLKLQLEKNLIDLKTQYEIKKLHVESMESLLNDEKYY